MLRSKDWFGDTRHKRKPNENRTKVYVDVEKHELLLRTIQYDVNETGVFYMGLYVKDIEPLRKSFSFTEGVVSNPIEMYVDHTTSNLLQQINKKIKLIDCIDGRFFDGVVKFLNYGIGMKLPKNSIVGYIISHNIETIDDVDFDSVVKYIDKTFDIANINSSDVNEHWSFIKKSLTKQGFEIEYPIIAKHYFIDLIEDRIDWVENYNKFRY